MQLIIEIEDTGLGDPLTASQDGKPVELFVGSLAFRVAAMDHVDDSRLG